MQRYPHDYLRPLIYLNQREYLPITLGFEMMRTALFGRSSTPQQYPYLIATVAVYAVPIIVCFFLAQRTFIEGIAVTGLKG